MPASLPVSYEFGEQAAVYVAWLDPRLCPASIVFEVDHIVIEWDLNFRGLKNKVYVSLPGRRKLWAIRPSSVRAKVKVGVRPFR